MTHWLGLPVAGSAQAAVYDRVTVLIHLLIGAIFLVWLAYFVYALVRFRRGRQPQADFHSSKAGWATAGAVAIAVADLVLLGLFALPAWALRANGAPPPDQALVIRVVAQQFAWNVHYAGPDGQFGAVKASLIDGANPVGLDRSSPHGADDVVTINDVHVPLGRPVIVQLTSKDMVHSFGIPAMRVKQDAIPGMTIPTWFTPVVPGTFDIACSQLCGLGHYRMRGVLTVVPQAEFDAWLTQQSTAH